MTNKDISIKLTDLCIKANFEQTYSIYLKNAVKVGSNDNGDVLVTYITRSLNPFYDVDHIYLNVILNERDCDLYGKDYDFEFISFKPENDYKPTYIHEYQDNLPESEKGVILLPNALELVLNELNESGDDWLKEQTNIRERSRWFSRNAHYKFTEQFKEHYKELTWEERKENSYLCYMTEYLQWRRPIENNSSYKELAKMNEMGETAYNVEQERISKMMDEMFKSWKEKKELSKDGVWVDKV